MSGLDSCVSLRLYAIADQIAEAGRSNRGKGLALTPVECGGAVRSKGIIGLCLLLAGCAALPTPFPEPLARGDTQLAAGQYRAAIDAYDQFLQATPGDPAAVRVRATRTILDQLLVATTAIQELGREAALRKVELAEARRERATLHDKVAALKGTLDQLSALILEIDQQKTRRQVELTKTKSELAALQLELSQLTHVLDRLKEAELLEAEKHAVVPVLDPRLSAAPSEKK